MVKEKGLIRPHTNTFDLACKAIDTLLIIFTLYACAYLNHVEVDLLWTLVALVTVILFLAYAGMFSLYRSWRTSKYMDYVRTTSACWVISIASLVLLCFLFEITLPFNKGMLAQWMVLTFFTLCSFRGILRQFLFFLRRKNFNTRSAIILGTTKSGIRLKDELHKNPQLGVRFIGFYDDRITERAPLNQAPSPPTEGTCNDAVLLAKRGQVDQVYIALPIHAKKRTDYLLSLFSDSTVTVHIIPDFYDYQLLRARWHKIGCVTTLSIYDSPFEGIGSWPKRIVDIGLSVFALALLSLPMILIAALVKISSKGPAIFVQKRYGLDGRNIHVYKFRTMTTTDNGAIIKQATRNDNRITPLGKVLRATSLDEIPQLINVLQGNMSIVGPRPHAIAHNEEYRKIIKGYMLRHKVKPGLTGWAQVNGWRGETETLDKMKSRVEFDLEYINNWSLFFDFKIMLLTVFNGTLFNKNTY